MILHKWNHLRGFSAVLLEVYNRTGVTRLYTTRFNTHNKLNRSILIKRSIPTIGLGISTTILGINNADLKKEIANKESTTQPPTVMAGYKLPESVRPVHYDLTLKPHLDTGLFDGEVSIVVNIWEPTDTILVHSNGLTISSVKVGEMISQFDLDQSFEILRIRVSGIIEGEHVVNIKFSGDMKNRIVGLYKSTYTSEGNTRSIATSKFEPTYARQAFPCFDEPNMKASFTVHLLKPKGTEYIALSNMPEIEGTTEEEDGELVHFNKSVKMSTYLTCFIVSDFKGSSDVIESEIGKIPYRVFATPAQLSKTEYATKVGKAIMEFYLKYFNIPYPLPKLDLVAIPDFVSGAMEHWGLVTFRETALLYSPEISSTANKQRVATVVAHELAHSWFGNLVTMDWWNDLWLNEGFASYIEYKGVDAVETDWQMMDQFIVDDLHPVLILDATLGSHPIVQTVTTPDQITEIFDTISYNKGASILRMLESAIGENIFKQGVQNYLNLYAFGNAKTEHLLNELQKLSTEDVNIINFMDTWTVQMGYPILTVNRTDSGYRITQKRFLKDIDAIDNTPTPYQYKWTVPVTYVTKEKPNEPQQVWFNYTQEYIDIPVVSDWIKFNYHQVGYYRVNYNEEDWKKLIANLASLEEIDRAHLLEETFRIAEGSQLSYNIPLDFTKQLKEPNNQNYLMFNVASTVLKQMKIFLMTSAQYSDFKEYVQKIVTPAYEKYTWTENEGDSHITRRARVRVLDLACSMSHSNCLETAQTKFKAWLNENKALSQDLRELVYSYGMVTATKTEWDKLWEVFLKETDAGEKVRLMHGLASINDIAILNRLLDLAKDDTYIRKQDYFTLISYISYNPTGTNLVWDYVREHWPELVERFTLNDRNLGRMIPTITQTFATEVKKEEMEAFFKKYPEAGAGASARKQALENVENNIKWLERNKESVEAWIETNKDYV